MASRLRAPLLAVVAAGTTAGLATGIGIGALIWSGNGTTNAPNLIQEPTRAPSVPTTSAVSVGLPSEDEDWDPCAEPGLCAFADSLDRTLEAADIESVVARVRWVPVDCAEAREMESVFGVLPVECIDWTSTEPILTVPLGLAGSEGGPATPLRLRQALSRFFSDVGTEYCEVGPARAGVIALVLPPASEFVFAGERGMLIGAPVGCNPSGPQVRYHLGLVKMETGDWGIGAFVRVGGLGYLPRSGDHDLYVSKFRYYPVD